ncbi:MAG: tRNA (adenosine(37)-N6)-dimethylallyltransferase MiaA [Bacteroidales bacterium]|nr:tRNA (adenosine(37)-N6)-dimethylallyltransferase MiaA [Bacteroidales bacterium]
MMPEMITILGPTATGKTRLAAMLAERMKGEIISADSRQVYRGMDIGTGKDMEDYSLGDTVIPYHLIDIADPGTVYNLFSFVKDFVSVFNDIVQRDTMPILCGGSGLYLEAAICGYQMSEASEDKILRAQLEALDTNTLINRLKNLRPLHNTTDITDRERLIRAIEIAAWERGHPESIVVMPVKRDQVFGIKMPRHEVRSRITERLEKRLEEGMIDEVKQLLAYNLTPEQLMFYGLEYKYITEYVIGMITYDKMFTLLNTAIHQFSKRQMTWYRRMEKRGVAITWIDGMNPQHGRLEEILYHLQRRVGKINR